MAIVVIDDGDTIENADFVSSWAAIRAEINAQNVGNVERHTFGSQHLPNILAPKASGANYGRDNSVIAAQTVSAAFTGPGISLGDVRTAWDPVLSMNGGGAGYVLPPCQVVMFAFLQVHDWAAVGTGDTNKAFAAITHGIGSGAETWVDSTDYGFVLCEGQESNGDALTEAEYGEYTIDIWTVLDQTGAGGDWTLDFMTVRCAMDTNAWELGNGMAGFFAIYRDD